MDKDNRRQDKHTSSVIKKGKFVIKKKGKNICTRIIGIQIQTLLEILTSLSWVHQYACFLMVLICDFVSFEVMCMQILENVVIDIINE